jgi:NTP pyrophosphatase (non-canonical NTP hydrolase)
MASGDDSAANPDDQAAIRNAQQAEADEAEEARESKNGSSVNEEIGDVLDELPEE